MFLTVRFYWLPGLWKCGTMWTNRLQWQALFKGIFNAKEIGTVKLPTMRTTFFDHLKKNSQNQQSVSCLSKMSLMTVAYSLWEWLKWWALNLILSSVGSCGLDTDLTSLVLLWSETSAMSAENQVCSGYLSWVKSGLVFCYLCSWPFFRVRPCSLKGRCP